MKKNIFEKTLSIFRSKGSFDKNKGVSEHKRILKDEFEMFETALELGRLYKRALILTNYINDNIYIEEINEYGERNHYGSEAEIELLEIESKIEELENDI